MNSRLPILPVDRLSQRGAVVSTACRTAPSFLSFILLVTASVNSASARADELTFQGAAADPDAVNGSIVAATTSGQLVAFEWRREARIRTLVGKPLGLMAEGRFAVVESPSGPTLLFADRAGVLQSKALGANGAPPEPLRAPGEYRDVLAANLEGDRLSVLAVDRSGVLRWIQRPDSKSEPTVREIAGVQPDSAALVAVAGAPDVVLAIDRSGRLVEIGAASSGEPAMVTKALLPRAAGSPRRVATDDPQRPAFAVGLQGGDTVLLTRKQASWSRTRLGAPPVGFGVVAGQLARDGSGWMLAAGADRTSAVALMNRGDHRRLDWEAQPASADDGVLVRTEAGAQFVTASYLAGAWVASHFDTAVLTIDDVTPAVRWTRESLTAHFTLRNRSTATMSGTVRAVLLDADGNVVGEGSTRVAVTGLASGDRFEGTATVTAPSDPQTATLAVVFSSTDRMLCLLGAFTYGAASAPANPRAAVPGVAPCSGYEWAQAVADVAIHDVREPLATDDTNPSPPFTPGQSFACTSLSLCGNGRLDPPQPETMDTCPSDASASRLRTYNSQVVCQSSTDPLSLPREADVVQLVHLAANAPDPATRKLRVFGTGHTGNAQLCSTGFALATDSLRAPNARDAAPGEDAEIRTAAGFDDDATRASRADRWARVGYPVVETFENQRTVLVAPGASLFDLADWLWQRPDQNDRPPEQRERLSLGLSLPGFRSPTVGGAVATGTHGSSTRWPDVISQRVMSIRLVTAAGEVNTYSAATTGVSDPDLWRALKANLGYLGVVTELRLAVEPAFKLRVHITTVDGTALLASGGPARLVSDCDFGQIMWFPGGDSASAGSARVICGTKVDANTPGDADSRLFDPLNGPFIDGWQNAVGKVKDLLAQCTSGVTGIAGDALSKLTGSLLTALVNRDMPEIDFTLGSLMLGRLRDASCSGDSQCPSECVRRVTQELKLPFLTQKSIDDAVVGPAHRLLTSKVADAVDQPLQRDWELFVPRQNAAAVLQAARDTYAANGTCLPLVGVFLRFALANSDTLMAHTTALGPFVDGEAGMFFEAPAFLPDGMRCSDLRRYEAPHFTLAKQLMEQFDARPHWAKNYHTLFQSQRLRDPYGANQRAFQHAVEMLDPQGLFANQFGIDMGLRWADDVIVTPADRVEACVPDGATIPAP